MPESEQAALGTALVTGGAQRIGAEICRALHRSGLNLIIHYGRSAHEANALADTLNKERANSAILLQADLQDHAQLQGLAERAAILADDLNLLVNNASAFDSRTLAGTDQQLWQHMHSINTEAPYFLAQALAELLRKNAGSIVNIVDIHARHPLKNYSAYCASKAGLLGITQSLALEMAPFVRVNAVSPGAILWPEGNEEEFSDQKKQVILEKIPLRDLGKPRDIANAVRFLALHAPYITGEVINVDGGRSISV
ncbi:MAG: pteridine reductase [Pseudomonadales bacterium]